MKFLKFIVLSAVLVLPTKLLANDFQSASQLLVAAREGNVQQIQNLINAGANVNYVDKTGMSIVCTALMNNDTRSAQVLQMYGADASGCDRQIKKYKSLSPEDQVGGLFSGLSTPQNMFLTVLGGGAAIGGVALLADSFGLFGGGNSNSGSTDNGECGRGNTCTCPNGNIGTCDANGNCDCTDSSTGTATEGIVLPYGPAMPDAEKEAELYAENLNFFDSDNVTAPIADNFELITNADADATN